MGGRISSPSLSARRSWMLTSVGALVLSLGGCAVAIRGMGEPEVQVGDKVRVRVLSDVAPNPVEGRLEAVGAYQFVVRSNEDPTTLQTFARGDLLRLELAVPLWRIRFPTCALAAGFLSGALSVYEGNGPEGLFTAGLLATGAAVSGWACARPPTAIRWRLARLPPP